MNVFNAFIDLILGKKTTPAHSQPASRSFGSSLSIGTDNAARGQLVQVMLRDLIRKSGMPPGWVQCQIQVVASRSRGPGIYVRLIVKHWDQRIMTYAFAFQKALLTDIVRFEPQAQGWLHGISWQLEVASTCPYQDMPDKNFWLEAPPPLGAQARAAPQQPSPSATPAPAKVLPTAGAVARASAPLPAPVKEFVKPVVPLFVKEDFGAHHDAKDNEAKEDLERLFSIRDHELAHQGERDGLPQGYEKTQPSPLT